MSACSSAPSSGPSCSDLVEELCSKACYCGAACAIDFGVEGAAVYLHAFGSEETCVGAYSIYCNQGGLPPGCSAAIASSECVLVDGGVWTFSSPVVMDGGVSALAASACEVNEP